MKAKDFFQGFGIVVAMMLGILGCAQMAQATPRDTGEVIFAMVKISQPLVVDDKVFEDHEISGSLYANHDACMARAQEEMTKSKVEELAGTGKFRVFAGCITIPAPGKNPTIAPHLPPSGAVPSKPGLTL